MTFQPAVGRLQTLRVADVMNQTVVSVEWSQSMEQTARLFVEHGISAAPVVDEAGRCVGMISATDFLRRDAESGLPESDHILAHTDPETSWEVVERDDTVQGYMRDAVQTISESATLLDAARIMSLEHIHRLPVLSPEGQLLGVISTMDITAAVINIIDELESL